MGKRSRQDSDGERPGEAPEHDAGGPPDYRDSEALAAFLLETLRKANRPLPMDALLRITRLPRKAKKKMEECLYRLQEEGRALRSANGWSAPARLKQVRGTLAVQQAGMGFVTPDAGGPEIYIHPAALNDAWPGDTVAVLVLPGKRGPSPEGRVLHVLRRAQRELPVHTLRRQKQGLWLCAPGNTRIPALFLVDTSDLEADPAPGDLLLARLGEKEGPQLWQALATANLEHEATPAAQERVAKSNHGIPTEFPPAVLAAVRELPENPGEEEFAGRRDLRDMDFVTIDGRTARDFDDAVHVENTGSGYRLRVAIADVAHYVRQGTALDAEARLRGNSCYFPLSVEPMLPEALSNGLCSLNPLTPRLAMVAELTFTALGVRTAAAFFPAVIMSRARLTYGQIERALVLGEKEESEALTPFLPMLREAEALARQLLERRADRGSLDFDLPEVGFRFDEQGRMTGIEPRKRHFGHRIIEECMIAANEAVAEFLEKRGEPTLYRVHQPPDPDKLAALTVFLAQTGLGGPSVFVGGRKTPPPPTGRDLRRMSAEVRGTPQEYTVTRLILRSMMQARYQPENEGHFGLASSCYCHFTSPIRRYADLVVHRSLKHTLDQGDAAGGKALSRARLEAVAEHINATERAAMEAEREVHKRLSVMLLADRVGEIFAGVVSGVTDFGIFVELSEVMAEGMVRLASLTDDFYELLPERQELRGKHTRKSFYLGQRLRVLLTDVNASRLEINLSLADVVDAPRGDAGGAGPRNAARKNAGSGKGGTKPTWEKKARPAARKKGRMHKK